MKIGILGAGQLGRMLALAGYPLGFEFVFFDPAEDACASPLGEHLRADYADESALKAFAERIDLATFEFENVPVATAESVAARVPLRPGTMALKAGQDRLDEKRLFERLGIPVPRHAAVGSRKELAAAFEQIGPSMLKTRRLGYDGKGQVRLRQASDCEHAWQMLGQQPLILESFVAFEREVSCIGIRGLAGELAFYPLVENCHREGILHTSRPRANDPLQAPAEAHVRRVMEHLDYVGVMAFEFFVADGKLLANEIAPRVHNSGHWTIEGAETSQFENHLRAISGLPLGATGLRGASLMLNFVGSVAPLQVLAETRFLHLHLYGKAPKPLRKLGHATLVASSDTEVTAAYQALQRRLEGSSNKT